MLNMSPTISTLSAALVAATSEMEHATKNALNPHFGNRYANLSEVIDVTQPILARHGLSLNQFPGDYVDGVLTLHNLLMHSSGEWIMSDSQAPLAKSDPQGVGSGLTYLRRYSLAAICGITQEDDDGNSATSHRHVAYIKEIGERGQKLGEDAKFADGSSIQDHIRTIWEDIVGDEQIAKQLLDDLRQLAA
jgi:hypothetical protein